VQVPDFEEEKEAAGRFLLDAIIKARLIPLGALQAAVDAEGRFCVARTPRLGPYFSIGELAEEPAVATVGSRVVVQPDFSVVVIGLSTGPLADLAPFCERVTRGGTPGAVQLKITREAVIRAVGHGLSVDQILKRLETHSSHALPPNVILEIKEWGGRVRKVKVESIKVIRCPDRETADRVASALRKSVERLNDTLLALDAAGITAVDRKKLQEHGLLVEGSAKGDSDKPAKKKAKPRTSRRW
jgi:Helicase conserved C-terminal domain